MILLMWFWQFGNQPNIHIYRRELNINTLKVQPLQVGCEKSGAKHFLVPFCF
jgi:hypothetical protein